MNIYERLKIDHHKQRELLSRISNTQGDSKERRDLWAALKIELEAHASAEEQTFYAELMSHPEASDKTRHSVAEHDEIADLVEKLDNMDMSSPSWLQKAKKLKDCTEHHLEEEEQEVFKLARRQISDERGEALASEYNQRKPAEVRKERAG